MLDKALASVSIGSAEVDTIVEDDVLVPGEPFSGRVVVQGGNADQRIEGLEHRLTASTPDEDDVSEVVLDSWEVTGEFVIHEDEREEIPFEAVLHPETPVTELDVRTKMDVWLETGLAIDKAVDDSDTDHLRVAPTDPIETMIAALDHLGLELYQVTADAGMVTVGDRQARVGYDQEFDFRETDRYDGPRFDEYQLHFVPRPLENRTDVLIEVERDGDVFISQYIDHVRGYSVESLADEFSYQLGNA